MQPEDILTTILHTAKHHGAEFAEAVVSCASFALKRVSFGRLDQVPARERWAIDAAIGKNGRSQSIRFDNPEFAAEAVRRALDAIDRLPKWNVVVPNVAFPEVLHPHISTPSGFSSDGCIECIARVRDGLGALGASFSGKVVRSDARVAYGNTVGTFQFAERSHVSAAFFVFDENDPSRSVYASSGGADFDHIDERRIVDELTYKHSLMHGRKKINPVESSIGAFDLIAEPYFFDRIFRWLGSFGWNGLLLERGGSVFSHKTGTPFLSPLLTVRDDPFDVRLKGIGSLFDFEGRPRVQNTLIEKGVPVSAAYDTALADRYGRKPTGNALLPSRRMRGAVPYDIVVEGGTSDISTMIRDTSRRALWVTRLHYLAAEDRERATLTGIAQHGVFLVEGGRVVGPAENVRFELSIPEAFANIDALSPSRLVFDPRSPLSPSGIVLPAMKIRNVSIIGSTERSV